MANPNPPVNPSAPNFGSGTDENQAPKKPAAPKLSATREALRNHSTIREDLYKFPEPPTQPGMVDAKKTALTTAGQAAFSPGSGRRITPRPLTEQFVPVEKTKSWASEHLPHTLSRTGFYIPKWPISTGKKGFWDSWKLGRKYLSSGRVGNSIDTQSELQGSAKAVASAIKADAANLQGAEKATLIRNIDLEANQQKQKLMEFYFGENASMKAKVNANNSITFNNATIANQMSTDAAMNAPEHQNYKTLCETYNKMPLATDSAAAKKTKQDEALAIIAGQCAAIDANAQRLKDNIDTFQAAETANLDKDLESKKQQELENIYTRNVNALKNDADPSKSNDPTLRSIDENGKVPESQIKDFKINGFRVTEEVDKEGNKGYQFHRQTDEERAKEQRGKYNVFTPAGALRVVGASIASVFRIASAVLLFRWKGLGKDLKEDWGKFTARGPFADTRYSYSQKKAFDKFLDILIKPGHTYVTATADTTPDEQRQLWLKAQTINPGMKVYIGEHEYKPTASDLKKLREIQQRQEKQTENVERKTLESTQKTLKFGQDAREWINDKFPDAEDADKFHEWWSNGGGREAYDRWNNPEHRFHGTHGTDEAVKKHQTDDLHKPVNPEDNKDRLDTWFEKSSGRTQFENYQEEQRQQSLTGDGGRGPS